MRIMGGQVRGIHIRAPRGQRTRPTSDKVREALFSILGESISGAVVLDLFAGSGAVALDALSRGAKQAVLVERDPAATEAIRDNLEKTGLGNRARILKSDFRSAVARLSREGERFDLVFVDPPYHQDDVLDTVIDALENNPVTAADCTIIVEHFGKISTPTCIVDLPLSRTRSYGQTSLSFYARTS